MAVEVQCPQCARVLPVANSLVGQNIKCPTCQMLFQAVAAAGAMNVVTLAPAPPPEPIPAPQTPAELPHPPPVPAPTKPQSVACPFCAEPIPADAIRCPYCTERLNEAYDDYDDEFDATTLTGRRLRRDVEPHRGGVLMVFAVVSIVGILFDAFCPLFCLVGIGFGIAAINMSGRDITKIQSGVMDPNGLGPTRSARTCATVGLCLHCALLVICGMYYLLLFGGFGGWRGFFWRF